MNFDARRQALIDNERNAQRDFECASEASARVQVRLSQDIQYVTWSDASEIIDLQNRLTHAKENFRKATNEREEFRRRMLA